jgi:uncharacterized protein YutE (UPF0331/DUF86 family)
MSITFDEDVVMAKVSTIRKCVATIRSLADEIPEADKEWMRLDLTALNLQRAVEATLDLASHLISANGWELPRDSRHAFQVVAEHGIVSGTSRKVLDGMVGFRNIAVHNYRDLDPAIVRGIAAHRLGDLEAIAGEILKATVAAAWRT